MSDPNLSPAKKILVDQAARDRIRHDFDATLVIEAAAGTGKTTETIARIIGLLEAGRARLSEIACVTFTEKAAGEMKLRLRTEVEREKKIHAENKVIRDRLDHALAELETARIGTIHGFCADILRERPVEAKVDPLFQVASEDEAEALFGECFDKWFQEKLEAPGEGLQRVLRRRARDRFSEGPRSMLSAAGFRLTDARDFPTPWEREAFDRKPMMDAVMKRLESLGAVSRDLPKTEPPNFLVENLREIDRAVSEVTRREQVQNTRDYDGLEAELKSIARFRSWTWKGSGKFLAKGVETQVIRNERDGLKADLDVLVAKLDADLAACLFVELSEVVALYEKKKSRAGRLDFRDLLVKTRDLLRDDLVVRAELGARFSHLLVDEFQDTDPLQAEILLFLAAERYEDHDAFACPPRAGKIFVVGDPKQSIYRFRRADVSFYERVKTHLATSGASVLHLSTSFRSAPSIQRAINAAFEPLMRGQPGQAAYVPLEAFKAEPEDHPTIIALPVPRPYSDWGKVVGFRIEESLPDATAAFIDWLVRESKYTVEERGERVPLAARHICILFKRLQSFGDDRTRPYVRALETRRIAHALVGGRSFYLREEVGAIISTLTAIEWPDDELSVYATLRGPFFALTDAEILTYKKSHGLHPFHPQNPAALSDVSRPVATAMDVLRRLHRARNRRPFSETVRRLLEETRAHAGLAFWPAGEQALANVLRMLDVARRFERSRPKSFRAFVSWLDEQRSRGSAQEAPVVEENTDGVRMMTVHRAKGLEFPVVILADPTAPATHRDPSRYVDNERGVYAMPLASCVPLELVTHRDQVLAEDAHESLRLLYVAATRAKEMLVIPTVGDQRFDKEWWLEPLGPVVYPKLGKDRASTKALNCPDFSGDSVFERPSKARADGSSSVRPGLHSPAVGDANVVWWDPHALGLDKQDEVGLRQQKILAADASGVVATEGEAMHLAWVEGRRDATTRASVATIRAETVTSRRSKELDASIAKTPVEIISSRRDGAARPHGPRFGTLVHAVLSSAPLDADDSELTRLAAFEGRMLGAPPSEIDAAMVAAKDALAHPLFARARKSPTIYRETSLALVLPDGALIHGACDLAFIDGDALKVVDYKTDVDVEAHLETYERQLHLYAAALSREHGAKETRGVLFLV